MLEYYITFRSMTRAQLGAAVLGQQGMEYQLLRAPRALALQGCGYALRVDAGMLSCAIQALHRGGVAFQRVYAMGSDGCFEELRP